MKKVTNRSVSILCGWLLLLPMLSHAGIKDIYLASSKLFESAGLPYSGNLKSDIGYWSYEPESDSVTTGESGSEIASMAIMLHENAHAFLFKLRDHLPASVAAARAACDRKMASSRYGDGFPEAFPDILAASLGGKKIGRFFVRMRLRELAVSGYRPYATHLLGYAMKTIDWSDANVLRRAARVTQKACTKLPFLKEETLSSLANASHAEMQKMTGWTQSEMPPFVVPSVVERRYGETYATSFGQAYVTCVASVPDVGRPATWLKAQKTCSLPQKTVDMSACAVQASDIAWTITKDGGIDAAMDSAYAFSGLDLAKISVRNARGFALTSTPSDIGEAVESACSGVSPYVGVERIVNPMEKFAD